MSDSSPSWISDTRQIMLSLSYLTYCGDQIITPDPDAEIGDLIWTGMGQIPILCTQTTDLGLVQNWQVVWGPVSYTTPGSLYQDSLMYVVKNQNATDQYVIAVRGTNHKSDLDWLMDDFDVLQQMPWPPGSSVQSATGMISESTSIALQVLLSMSNATQTLLQYFDSVSSEAIDLWVTGHSLGGCLASALGLYLTENRSAWDQHGQSNVSCVTFAAPTAGNSDFAALVENAFTQTNFDRVQCSLDIVPLAWDAANIYTPPSASLEPATSEIFNIYDLAEETGQSVDFYEMSFPNYVGWRHVVLTSMLPAVQSILTAPDYTQPFANAVPLPGNFNTASGYTAYDQDFATTAAAFEAQAGYQHSASYPTILGVTQLLDPNIINETGTGGGATRPGVRARSKFLRSLLVSAFDGLGRASATAHIEQGDAGGGGPPAA